MVLIVAEIDVTVLAVDVIVYTNSTRSSASRSIVASFPKLSDSDG